MRIVFTSYINTPSFNDPGKWIERIKGYTGVLESLAGGHEVISIEQINYEGKYSHNGVDYRFIDYGTKERLFPSRLHNYIKHLQPQLVVVHGFHFPFQLIQLHYKLGNKVKLLVQ